ncbi:putative reverse transcriptase - beet retrotransposon, partial [Trifolium medium]|nr:putative reverse transcriptase - beet retrotransposon [Trifolium medium]
MSRLDRVILSYEWNLNWGNPMVWVLPRDVSDHCPLVVKYSSSDWGPKPFRFNNFWLRNKSFKTLVVKTWEEQNFTGWMGFILKDRLKGLKIAIKEWHAEVYGNMEERKQHLIGKILDLDSKSESVGISD